ncbi:hypothetical protein A5644_14735 [Mycobacterium intracellulare subsp. yongonense]|nr:hypothetical protein A5644_14735 [Mycobacterium intracellulare subsp. yongonense]
MRTFFTGIKQRVSGKIFTALLALSVVTSVGLAAGLIYFQYLPDRATDAAAAKSAITVLTTVEN